MAYTFDQKMKDLSKSKTSAYDTYKILVGVRIHYQSDSYDYFKYYGECKAASSFEVFRQRNDKYSFMKLGRLYEPADMLYFIAVNLYETPNVWVHDLFFEEPNEKYKLWKANQGSREQKLKELFEQNKEFKQLVSVHQNEHPKLFALLVGKQIDHSLVAIIDKSLKFTNEWVNAYPNDVVITSFVNRFNKFKRFVENFGFYNISAYEKIIQEHT